MIDFDDAALERLLADQSGEPVTMLNLLRFRPDGGRERYEEYVAQTADVGARHGLQLAFAGVGERALVAEPGQEWDMVALVRYPDRRAFVEFVRDPDYRAVAHLRTEALLETVLQPLSAIDG